jgi:MFS family permease
VPLMRERVVGAPAAPPSRLRALLLLGGIAGLGPFSVDTYLPAFPQIADDLHATPSGVQLTLAAYLVAMATGQLLMGPSSDSWGRRRPLLTALVCYVLAALACAVAPTVGVLVALRVVQGLAGGAVLVIARAVVRDLYTGSDVTRFLSRLTLVFGLAPIVAPSLGSLVLTVTGWRGTAGGREPGVARDVAAAAPALGLTMPNATSLALEQRPDAAGAAAALLGFIQTVIGALVAPLVGLGPADSAVPTAIGVGVFGSAGLLALLTLALPAAVPAQPAGRHRGAD